MTKEETIKSAEEKAEELSKKYGCKLIPLVFMDAETQESIVGYLKEIPRIVKLRILDTMLTGAYSSCASVIEDYLIKEESDARILGDDRYFLGAVTEVYNMIQISVNQLKKN
jgi:hypothetical protein